MIDTPTARSCNTSDADDQETKYIIAGDRYRSRILQYIPRASKLCVIGG